MAVTTPPIASAGGTTRVVPADDVSRVGEARRAAQSLAAAAGFGETGAGRVGIVATEMATNLARHGREGVLLIDVTGDASGRVGISLTAVDRGTGIRDLARAMADGYSTAGTPGQGLGAMQRQSDLFDIHSQIGEGAAAGTVVFAQLWDAPVELPPGTPTALEVGGVCVPLHGEEVCGDAWAADVVPGRSRLMLADGLGHGPQAATAAQAAVRIFRSHPNLGPAALIEMMHGALRATRGAAVSVAEVRPDEGELRFAGIGNVAATIVSGGESRSLMTHNGTVGFQMRRPHELTYPWPADAVLVMASDGLKTHWKLPDYPGLALRRPTVVAAALWRDHSRGRDDSTVVVARNASAA